MSARVTVDQALITRATRAVVDDFATACNDSFHESVWAWPRTTRRSGGRLVGSPRDVVDTGRLKDSQQPAVWQGDTATISWVAPYAAAVFLGAILRERSSSLPARNLPLWVARGFDWQASFSRHL